MLLYGQMWQDTAATQFNSQTDPPDKVLLIEFQSEIHPGSRRRPLTRLPGRTSSMKTMFSPGIFNDAAQVA